MVGMMRFGFVAALASVGLSACANAASPTQPESAAFAEPLPSAQSGAMELPARPQIPALRVLTLERSNIAEAPNTLTVEEAQIPAEPTRVLDAAAAERLFGNSGVTLQWIGWDERGRVWIAVDEAGNWWLTAEQQGNGSLKLEGRISEIGSDYFLFDGEVSISGAPDVDRYCEANKQWRFAITQNRQYWRLREFEWCDRLTDYIDIYF